MRREETRWSELNRKRNTCSRDPEEFARIHPETHERLLAFTHDIGPERLLLLDGGSAGSWGDGGATLWLFSGEQHDLIINYSHNLFYLNLLKNSAI